MKKVLILFPHGLGDAVQLVVILKHLRKYRPDWEVSVRAKRGKHSACHGFCKNVWHDQESMPAEELFDRVYELGWYENFNGYTNRPNTKITNCLEDTFGLGYDPELGRYEILVPDAAKERAAEYLSSIGCTKRPGGRFNAVCFHYEGNTSGWKKNLQHWQVREFCELAIRLGCIPIVLDWDCRSPLPDQKRIFNPGVGKYDIWGGFGSGDASMIAALVGQAEAFVGIDSGPGKVASATDTPTLICWMGHHPIQFHDPANNTIHLIPQTHRSIPPAHKPGVAEYFEKHYPFHTYAGAHGMVEKACGWLEEKLASSFPGSSTAVSHEFHESTCRQGDGTCRQGDGRKFVVPNGIGDVVWALHKIQSIAAGQPIDILLSGDPSKEIDRRAIPFVKRFPFVRSVDATGIPALVDREHQPTDAQGRYRYMPDGPWMSKLHFLSPNATLERGERLETWLPEHPCDWSIIEKFDWSNTDKGAQIGKSLGRFAAFYLGPERGNVDDGHNRGFLWEPKHWVSLGQALTRRGLKIVVVGADYDRSYWERYVRTGVGEAGMEWVDHIGGLEIGETYALLRQAKVFVSYQCGLGIVAHYLGVPVVMWWRPDGDSSHPERMVSFANGMKDAWTNPKYQDRYLGCLYRRETPTDIMDWIDEKGWLND